MTIVDKPYGEVWSLTTEWYALSNVTLANIDKEDGLINSEKGMPMPEGVDCGKAAGQVSWASAKLEEPTGSISTMIRRIDDNRTKIITKLTAYSSVNIRNGYGAVISSAHATCVSTGRVEQLLVDYVNLSEEERNSRF